jgi:hypothetical protein
MKRSVWNTAIAVSVALLSATTMAYAAPVTLIFSGTSDLSSVNGPADSTFSGFVTWDPAAVPFETEPNSATYDVLAYSLIFNGVDVTGPILGSGTGNGIFIQNDDPNDLFGFFAAFEAPFPVPGGGGDLILLAALAGPPTMFDSTALPPDLSFLASVELSQALWLFERSEGDEFFLNITGPLVVSAPDVTAVPEPTSLTLTALGLAGLLRRRCVRARRKNLEQL